MTYTAVAVLFLLACTALGTFIGPAMSRPRLVACCAIAMVVLQLLVIFK